MDTLDYDKCKEAFLAKFEKCRQTLSAFGDDTRQLIIKILIECSGQGGIRVGEIQKSTNISRTAVSHHLKVLVNAGIIRVRHCGTKNYYYIDPENTSLKLIEEFWQEALNMMSSYPMVTDKQKL